MMLKFNNKKIFCIGFNKTGTSSLHRFFKDSGLDSVHNAYWPNYTKVRFGKLYFYGHDAYCDGEQADFITLDNWFKDAVFILNTRNNLDWIISRIKHINRYETKDFFSKELLVNRNYGKMAKEYFANKEEAIIKFLMTKIIYEKSVREYFSDRENFLEIDVTKNENWTKKLKSFLQKNNFKLSNIKQNSYHLNKRKATVMKNKKEIDAEILLAKQIINKLDFIL